MKTCVVSACGETVPSSFEIYYKAYMLSIYKVGITPIILRRPWVNSISKLRIYKEFMRENINNYDIIICCDAYDIIFQFGMDEIIKRFTSLNVPILFSAEMNCWPDISLRIKYPQSPTMYTCLNAGFCMGYIKELFHLFNSFTDVQLNRVGADDQFLFSEHFINNNIPKITLDYYQNICQNLYLAKEQIIYEEGAFRNFITRTYPCVFHGNGVKPNLLSIIEKLVPETLL